jgi:hypothetical protein
MHPGTAADDSLAIPDIGKLYPTQQVALDPKSVSAQTSYLGFAILLVSLGFFYLYLANVYPISVPSSLGLDKAFQGLAASPSPSSVPSQTTSPQPKSSATPKSKTKKR